MCTYLAGEEVYVPPKAPTCRDVGTHTDFERVCGLWSVRCRGAALVSLVLLPAFYCQGCPAGVSGPLSGGDLASPFQRVPKVGGYAQPTAQLGRC